MSKQPRIAPDVKEQILDRIKNQGVSVTQAAKDHSVSTHTIYKWLGAKTESGPSILEFAKLKKENEELLKLVGLMTLKLFESQKKK